MSEPLREEPCFLLIFIYVSLLHGSVFDQFNGIFSTTRVLDGRDPGDIGHFLVAIRQWKPPTVKTTGKEKKRDRCERVKVSSNGELDSNQLTGSFNYRIFLAGQIYNSEGLIKRRKRIPGFDLSNIH